MPNVVCPSCKTTLSVTDAMLGGEVQCGQCQTVFRTATGETKRGTARRDDEEESRPSRSRPRRDEEDEDERPSRRSRVDQDDELEARSRSARIRTKYCQECGETIRKAAEICPKCGVRQPGVRPRYEEDYDDEEPRRHRSDDPAGKKVVAGVMGILFGGLGIHKFILGYGGAGAVMLLITLLSLPIGIVFGGITCGVGCLVTYLGGFVMGIIGLIEGIMYLCTDDREFRRNHRRLDRPWF